MEILKNPNALQRNALKFLGGTASLDLLDQKCVTLSVAMNVGQLSGIRMMNVSMSHQPNQRQRIVEDSRLMEMF